MLRGTITSTLNQGTLAQVFVETDAGQLVPVNFDRRMFRHMVEARGAERIVGQAVTLEYPEDGEVLVFGDEES